MTYKGERTSEESDAKIIWETCHSIYLAQLLSSLPSRSLSKFTSPFPPHPPLWISNLKQETVSWQRISWCIMRNTITNSSQGNTPLSKWLIEKMSMRKKIFSPHIYAFYPEEKNIIARNLLQFKRSFYGLHGKLTWDYQPQFLNYVSSSGWMVWSWNSHKQWAISCGGKKESEWATEKWAIFRFGEPFYS